MKIYENDICLNKQSGFPLYFIPFRVYKMFDANRNINILFFLSRENGFIVPISYNGKMIKVDIADEGITPGEWNEFIEYYNAKKLNAKTIKRPFIAFIKSCSNKFNKKIFINGFYVRDNELRNIIALYNKEINNTLKNEYLTIVDDEEEEETETTNNIITNNNKNPIDVGISNISKDVALSAQQYAKVSEDPGVIAQMYQIDKEAEKKAAPINKEISDIEKEVSNTQTVINKKETELKQLEEAKRKKQENGKDTKRDDEKILKKKIEINDKQYELEQLEQNIKNKQTEIRKIKNNGLAQKDTIRSKQLAKQKATDQENEADTENSINKMYMYGYDPDSTNFNVANYLNSAAAAIDNRPPSNPQNNPEFVTKALTNYQDAYENDIVQYMTKLNYDGTEFNKQYEDMIAQYTEDRKQYYINSFKDKKEQEVNNAKQSMQNNLDGNNKMYYDQYQYMQYEEIKDDFDKIKELIKANKYKEAAELVDKSNLNEKQKKKIYAIIDRMQNHSSIDSIYKDLNILNDLEMQAEQERLRNIILSRFIERKIVYMGKDPFSYTDLNYSLPYYYNRFIVYEYKDTNTDLNILCYNSRVNNRYVIMQIGSNKKDPRFEENGITKGEIEDYERNKNKPNNYETVKMKDIILYPKKSAKRKQKITEEDNDDMITQYKQYDNNDITIQGPERKHNNINYYKNNNEDKKQRKNKSNKESFINNKSNMSDYDYYDNEYDDNEGFISSGSMGAQYNTDFGTIQGPALYSNHMLQGDSWKNVKQRVQDEGVARDGGMMLGAGPGNNFDKNMNAHIKNMEIMEAANNEYNNPEMLRQITKNINEDMNPTPQSAVFNRGNQTCGKLIELNDRAIGVLPEEFYPERTKNRNVYKTQEIIPIPGFNINEARLGENLAESHSVLYTRRSHRRIPTAAGTNDSLARTVGKIEVPTIDAQYNQPEKFSGPMAMNREGFAPQQIYAKEGSNNTFATMRGIDGGNYWLPKRFQY